MKITLCFIVAFISVCCGYTIERKLPGTDSELCQQKQANPYTQCLYGRCYLNESGVPKCKCFKDRKTGEAKWIGELCNRRATFGGMEGFPNFPFKRLLDALLDEVERDVDSQEFYEKNFEEY